MKINAMDDERIAISNIENIEAITFSELTNNSGNNIIKPMLSVAYNGANVLVLTSDDKNFDFFVKKVRDIYLKEKDKPIEGSILKRHINIDDLSKKIFLSDTITQTSDLYKYYSNIDSYGERLISSEHEVKALIPLIDYVINSNLSNINRNAKLEKGISGYSSSGLYTIYESINGIYVPIPLRITKNNNSYNILIGNIFGELNPLNVIISFNKTDLNIISTVDSLNYNSYEDFKYEDGLIINNKEIYINGKCLYKNPNKYEKVLETPSITKLDENDSLDWFKLPWGASIGFKNEENIIDNESKTVYRKVQYVENYEDTLINIESAEKRFVRRTKDFRKVKDIVFDDVDKTMTCFKDKDCIFIETAFNENGTLGTYKDLYAGKYFYQFSNAQDFNSINKEFEIYEPGDLRDNYKIRKKVKGN